MDDDGASVGGEVEPNEGLAVMIGRSLGRAPFGVVVAKLAVLLETDCRGRLRLRRPQQQQRRRLKLLWTPGQWRVNDSVTVAASPDDKAVAAGSDS